MNTEGEIQNGQRSPGTEAGRLPRRGPETGQFHASLGPARGGNLYWRGFDVGAQYVLLVWHQR